MENSIKEQVAALAGVFQAAALVEELTQLGELSENSLYASIQSIFMTSPNNVSEVYGGYDQLKLGSKMLKGVLTRDSTVIQSNVIRYSLGLLHLERKLCKNKLMLDAISKRLEHAKNQITHFGLLHENVISNLASIYLDTISTFKTRIQVTGNPSYLKATENTNKIRTIFLAGIRSATLWQQVGGSRWHLFFYRKKLLNGLKEL